MTAAFRHFDRGGGLILRQHPGDLVLQHHTLFPKVDGALVRRWLHLGFNTVNLAVDDMVFVKKFGEMRVRHLQLVQPVDFAWKFFGKLMWNVRQFYSPCFHWKDWIYVSAANATSP